MWLDNHEKKNQGAWCHIYRYSMLTQHLPPSSRCHSKDRSTEVLGNPTTPGSAWWCFHRHNLLGDVTRRLKVLKQTRSIFYHLISSRPGGPAKARGTPTVSMDTSPSRARSHLVEGKPSERIDAGSIVAVQAASRLFSCIDEQAPSRLLHRGGNSCSTHTHTHACMQV